MLACAAVRINLLYFVVPEPIYDDFMLDRFTILYLTSLMDTKFAGVPDSKEDTHNLRVLLQSNGK